MSVSRNFGRTLSGATDLSIDNISLPDYVNTIKINGNSGLPNQFLGKNGITGKLEWDYVETSSIPDNSIDNAKLKNKTIENNKIRDNTIIGSLIASDIAFSTTGTINANKFTADAIDLPKTGTARTILDNTGGITGEIISQKIGDVMTCRLSSDGIDIYGANKSLIASGSSARFSNLYLTGSHGITSCLISGNVIITSSNGDTPQDGNITIIGDYSSTNGDITLTNGDITSTNGDITGDIVYQKSGGITTCRLSSDGIDIFGANKTLLATGSTATFSNLILSGSHGLTSCVISGNLIITSSSGDTPQNGNLTILGDYSSTNGNITLTNGDITLTNGVFRGRVIGDITEEHIHAQSLEIRSDGSGGGDTGIDIKDGYNLTTYSDSGITQTFSLDGSNGNINIGGTTTFTGDMSSTNGNITLTNGDITLTNGVLRGDVVGDITEEHIHAQSLEIRNNGTGSGDTGIEIKDGYDLITYSDSGITQTFSLDGSNGNINIGGTTTFTGDMSSTNGNITLTNGDITLTNGVLRGDVVGDITEEHIHAQSLEIRNNGTGSGDTGIEIKDGYDLITYSDSGITQTFSLDGSNGNISAGSISGTSLSSSNTITATNLISGGAITTSGLITATGTSGYIGVGTNADTYNILLNKNGVIECVDLQATEVDATTLDGDTIIFNTKLQQTTASNFNVDSSGNLTIGGTTSFVGDITSTNGNITLTNGDITLTNGAFRGEVIGDITEEHIHAQSLEIRSDGSGGGDTGIDIKDGYDITFETGSGGNIIMSNGLIRTSNTSTSTMDLDFNNGLISLRNGYLSQTLMSISDELITINNPTYPSITGTTINSTTIRINNAGNNDSNPRIILDSIDGIKLFTGTSLNNLLINPLGDISFKTGSGDLYGYDGNGSVYTANSTRMQHFRLDETNYKNHLYEIGVSIPLQTYLERTITTTSTAWFDLNNQLSVRLISNSETNSYFVVDFSFYAVITAGARIWFKLFDTSIGYIDNFYQPTYLNNTTSQFVLDTNGASDFAGVHNVRFYVGNFPANTTKTIRVACWVITTAGHKVIFKSGPLTLGSTSNNPSTSYNKYPPQFLQAHKLLASNNVSTNSPSGWTSPSSGGDDY